MVKITKFFLALVAGSLFLSACSVSSATPSAAEVVPSPSEPTPTEAMAQVVLPTATPENLPTTPPVRVELPTVTPESVITATVAPPAAPLPYAVTLPPGFHISYYAQDVLNARSLAVSPAGTVFVGSRTAGNVYALVDQDGDQQAEQVITVVSGLNSPNGVAFQDNALYVAEIERIIRFDDIEANLNNPPAPVVVTQEYPTDTWHGWKYLRFGPDGFLYAPVGAPCNVCEPSGVLYGTITRLRPDGSGLEVYARGIRNTVGFDWDPLSQQLWFTDNGHDELGDDIPPDELNQATEPGLDFGFPYCHGGTIADPQFGAQHDCTEFTPPAIALGPHVAALGMRFYTGSMFPAEYQSQIFIAEHGSATRSTPIGYRVSLVRVVEGRATGYETFAAGWLQNGQALGRPVDLLVMADGALLVSDDTANDVYRISYQAEE